MVPEDWLRPSLVLTRVEAPDRDALLDRVVGALAKESGVDGARIRRGMLASMEEGACSLVSGVMVPHMEVPELDATRTCLAVTAAPLPLPAPDGTRPDVFFFVLSRPDPRAHLLLLAHVARLAQSRTMLEGVRRAGSAAEAVEIVRAAELRLAPAPAAAAPGTALVILSLGGEAVVDALLIALIDAGFEDGCILEAQGLREAAAAEVPLFVGFRDIFGDPGGRRMFLLEVPGNRIADLRATVRRVCEEHGANGARLSVIPVMAP